MRPWSPAIALSTALTSAVASASPPTGETESTAAPAPPAEDATPGSARPASPDATWVEPQRQPNAPSATPAGSSVDPSHRKLVVAGNVLTGVGLGAFVVMTAGFLVASDARDRLGFARAKEDDDEVAKQEQRIRLGNRMGISGAAAAGALLITGLTLIGVGRSRERKRRAALEEQGLVPLLGRGVAGVQWTVRF